MPDAELAWLPATELAALIRRRALSPVELMQATLARAEASQPVLNAFITLAPEAAMAAARAAEAAVLRGAPLGPLHGIPFSVKDLVATAGLRTTYGSRIFADNIPTTDAVTVARLRAAGGILFGKTTTPEFGQHGLTNAPLFGRTRNAWSAAHTAGGSSGGAAVAVAAGIGPIAVASDGGGSTRIPAACNGVVGLKQSLGLVPQEAAQDGFGNISYTTPMTRTVADTALMLGVMAGPDPRDPLSLNRPPFAASAAGLAGLRLGWRLHLGNTVIAADLRAAFAEAIAGFASLGLDAFEHAPDFANPEGLWFALNGAYRRAQYGHHIARHRAIMCPVFLRQMDRIADYPAAELQAAILARTTLFRAVQAWFDEADLIAMPTTARAALPIDQDFFGPIEIDNASIPNLRAAWYPYTMPFNLTGHPAIALPIGFDREGLPLSLQLVARPGADALLLHVAAAFEAARPWAAKRPSLPF